PRRRRAGDSGSRCPESDRSDLVEWRRGRYRARDDFEGPPGADAGATGAVGRDACEAVGCIRHKPRWSGPQHRRAGGRRTGRLKGAPMNPAGADKAVEEKPVAVPAAGGLSSLYAAQQKVYPRGVIGRYARLRTLAA